VIGQLKNIFVISMSYVFEPSLIFMA